MSILSSCPRMGDSISFGCYTSFLDWRCVQNLLYPCLYVSFLIVERLAVVVVVRYEQRHTTAGQLYPPLSSQAHTPCELFCVQWVYMTVMAILFPCPIVVYLQARSNRSKHSLPNNQSPNPTNDVAPMYVSISVSKTIVRCAGSHLEHIIAQPQSWRHLTSGYCTNTNCHGLQQTGVDSG